MKLATQVQAREHAMQPLERACLAHFARDVADRVWFLAEGKIREQATPQAFFAKAATPARQFLAERRRDWPSPECAALL